MSTSNQMYLVIGAGTFGLSTALALSKAGKKVTVFERSDTIPAVDSASNDINKVVRADYGDDLLYQGLAIESMRIFRSWNTDCLKQMGQIIYNEVGILNAASEAKSKDASDYNYLSFSSIQRAGYGSYLKRGAQIPTSWESLKQLRSKYPGGYFNSQGGWADSGKSIKYVAQKCREAGVKFKVGIPGTLVKFVKDERKTTAKVVGVEMKDGSRYFGTVILATGAWSASLLPELKHSLKAVGQPVIHIKVPEDCARRMYKDAPVWAVFSEGFYGFPPTKDGVVKIAKHSDGFLNIEKTSSVPSVDDDIESTIVDPSLKVSSDISKPKTVVSHPESGLHIPLESLYDFKQFLAKNFFFLTDYDITATRMCWYTDSFDGDFIMTRMPQQPNLYICTGGSGHGYKFLPVIGNIMLDVVNGVKTEATLRFAWREPGQVREGLWGKEQSRAVTGHQPNLSEVEMASAGDLLASVKAKI